MPNPKAVLLMCLFALGAGSTSAAWAAQPACPRVGFAVVQPQPSAQTRTVAFRRGRIHIDRTPVTAMDDIAAVRLEKGHDTSAVLLTFRPEAPRGWRRPRPTTRACAWPSSSTTRP